MCRFFLRYFQARARTPYFKGSCQVSACFFSYGLKNFGRNLVTPHLVLNYSVLLDERCSFQIPHDFLPYEAHSHCEFITYLHKKIQKDAHADFL